MTTTSTIEQVAWDAVVVLDWLSHREGRHKHIAPIVKEAQDGKSTIVVSVMAISETLYIDGKTSEESDAIIREFFDNEHVAPVAAGRNIAELAQFIRRTHGIGGMDSIHVATALITKTPTLLTNDGDGKSKRKKLLPLDNKLTHEGMTLRIVTPEQYPTLRITGPNSLPFQVAPSPRPAT